MNEEYFTQNFAKDLGLIWTGSLLPTMTMKLKREKNKDMKKRRKEREGGRHPKQALLKNNHFFSATQREIFQVSQMTSDSSIGSSVVCAAVLLCIT